MGGRAVWVCYRNCVHQSSPNWIVGKCSDHLQLIKFWPSRAPGKGVRGGANFFDSALLQPARSVCAPVSAFFIHSETFALVDPKVRDFLRAFLEENRDL